MSTVLDRIGDTVGVHGLRVRKAIPRGSDHLLLVLADRGGTKIAGQWFSDAAYARRVARETRQASGDTADISMFGDSGVLVQPDGADRRLRALHRLATAPGSSLIAHRAERRGLVRHEDRDGTVTFTKTVRPERFAAMLAGMSIRVGDVAVPRVVAVDPEAGTMTCTALPGRMLQELIEDPRVATDDLVGIGREVGRAVARLHASPPPAAPGHHDAADELAVTRGWLRRAHAYGLLDEDDPLLRARLSDATTLLAGPPCPDSYLHRDLHDLQVLVDDSGAVGILDFDLSTTGEPALDLANLLVHLELKVALGGCTRARAAACAEAVVEGYAPTAEVWRRVPGYAWASRLRLAAVYAFRPPHAQVGHTLLTVPGAGPLEEMEERP